MSANNNICIICAWRATCQKKFLVSGKDMKCADFVRDVSIKDDKDTEGTKKTDKSDSSRK